jgi:hypothetical protein
MAHEKIRWRKILLDSGTGEDLTMGEFVIQTLIVGPIVIGVFLAFTYFK